MKDAAVDDPKPEQVDLLRLGRDLASEFESARPKGYVPGKTALRSAVIRLLGCSEETAEDLVDALEARGVVRYDGAGADIDDLSRSWVFE
jgi:hypothetical protein